jgi:hypothetical protein
MPEWMPMFAMPNVQPQNSIDIEGVAFVSVFDDRIKALRAKYPNYDKLCLSDIQTRTYRW